MVFKEGEWMMEKAKITDYADEAIALLVSTAGTGCAVYLTYTTGQIPEFFSMGFGMVLAYYFGKSKKV